MPSLAELAAHLGAELVGSPERQIGGVRDLREAGPADLAFVAHRRHLPAAMDSAAGVLLVPPALAGELPGRDLLVVAEPRSALAALLERLHPPERPAPGVHPTAVVGAGSDIDPSAHIGPYAVIGDGTAVAAGAVVEAHCVVGRGCRIGAGCVLHPHVVLYDEVELGEGCEVHSGAVVGSDGFGFVPGDRGPRKVRQIGRTVVEPEVEIGANSTIDRGALAETRVGRGSKLDNLVHLAHNVRLGQGCLLAAQTGVAGSSTLGNGVMVGGQAGVSDHLEVGDGAQIAAKSAVFQTVETEHRVAGIPAEPMMQWQRRTVLSGRLPELGRRVAALERALGGEPERAEEEEA